MTDINVFVDKMSAAIQVHRKASCLTQNQLAAFAGVGKTVIFDLEHGKSTVRLDTLLKILAVLNIELTISSPLRDVNA
jgi:y4mF family transcriptional regulator